MKTLGNSVRGFFMIC